jgi:putative chitinase
MITSEQLKSILVNKHEPEFYSLWAGLFSEILPKSGIDTRLRIAAFVSQCAHESAEFTHLSENLNYSAQDLLDTWPSRFTASSAPLFARKPESIANHVYSNRNGNGPESSGDGWNYRGRGIIQITGRANYRTIGDAINIDIEGLPHLAELPEVAIKVACAYFQINSLNRHADVGDVIKLTRAINGGLNGLKDRQNYYNRAMVAL